MCMQPFEHWKLPTCSCFQERISIHMYQAIYMEPLHNVDPTVYGCLFEHPWRQCMTNRVQTLHFVEVVHVPLQLRGKV